MKPYEEITIASRGDGAGDRELDGLTGGGLLAVNE